ncbi:MAG: hypothetical protein EXX96DRAFT_588293 [Benjaminiella poitrasii]|nr:MAG: hypothetical protein EXX96DRAFT_588293 [Benjaminiella poitrasii]
MQAKIETEISRALNLLFLICRQLYYKLVFGLLRNHSYSSFLMIVFFCHFLSLKLFLMLFFSGRRRFSI